MTTVEVLEGMMLVCFSVSWYWSIAKMLRTKVASGKSLLFVLMICFGYILGIGSKVVAWYDGGVLSPLVWVYVWNLLVTAYDAVLVIHYSHQQPPPDVSVQGLQVATGNSASSRSSSRWHSPNPDYQPIWQRWTTDG